MSGKAKSNQHGWQGVTGRASKERPGWPAKCNRHGWQGVTGRASLNTNKIMASFSTVPVAGMSQHQ